MLPTTKPNRRFQTRALLLALGLATLPGVWPVSAETTATGAAQGRASLSATGAGPDAAGEQVVAGAVSQAQMDVQADLSSALAGDGGVSAVVPSGGGTTGGSSGVVGASGGLTSSGACPTTTAGLTADQATANSAIGVVLAALGSCDNGGPGGGQPGDSGTPPGVGLPAIGGPGSGGPGSGGPGSGGPGSGGPGSGGPGSGGPGSGGPGSGLPIDVLGFQVPGRDLPGNGNPRSGDQKNGLLPGGLLPNTVLPSRVLPGTRTPSPAVSPSDPIVARSGGTGVGGRALPGTVAHEIQKTPAAGAVNGGPTGVGPAQSVNRPLSPVGGELPRTGADLHVRALVGLGLLGLAGLRRRPRSIPG